MRIVPIAAVFYAVAALAQTGTPASPPASSNSLTSTPTAPRAVAAGSGTRVGTINIEQAIFNTNEGRRDFEALSKKLEPKQNELKAQNDELQKLQQQLQTQGSALNDDARAKLVAQIESKKKLFDRAVQDAQEDASNQQNEIAQRILQKMAPMIVKYAQDNSFGLIVDTSKPWPQSPVLWSDVEKIDITKPVVDAYNAQSGVPAPASGTPTPKPTSARPAGTSPKPAAPKSTVTPK